MANLRNQWPPGVIPCVEGGRTNAGFLGYGHERLCRAVVNNMNVVALINALLFSRRPSAILWGIWAVVIDAFNAVFGSGPAPHVSKELFERFFPAITNKNPAPAVVFIRLVGRIAAAFSHVHPGYVFRAVRQAVARFRSGYLRAGIAPAARTFSAVEVGRMNVLFFAADTATRDVCHRVGPVRISNHCPISERGSDGGVGKPHGDYLFLMIPLHYNGCLPMVAGV